MSASPWPLVAMENVFFSRPEFDWSARCAAVAAAGYDGIYAVPYPLRDEDFSRLHRLADEPQRHGLRLAAAYANVDLALPDTHDANRRTLRLAEATNGIPRLEVSFKCSDPRPAPADLDGEICARLEPLLSLAEQRGFEVALYPHSFYPLETIAHARAVIRRLPHPRLKFIFAASHVFAIRSAADTLAELAACATEIASCNICGCRRPGPPPDRCTHLPLDEGDLDGAALLRTLRTAGYGGELIIQGHGWPGNPGDFLRRTRAMVRRGVDDQPSQRTCRHIP